MFFWRAHVGKRRRQNEGSTRQGIIKLGFSWYCADKAFRECKSLLVTNGYSFYQNNKIKIIPKSVIERSYRFLGRMGSEISQ